MTDNMYVIQNIIREITLRATSPNYGFDVYTLNQIEFYFMLSYNKKAYQIVSIEPLKLKEAPTDEHHMLRMYSKYAGMYPVVRKCTKVFRYHTDIKQLIDDHTRYYLATMS